MTIALLAQGVPSGDYVSAWKVLPVLLVALAWLRWLTWVDKDAPAAHLPRLPINAGLWAGFVGGMFLFFLLPGFWLAFGVLLVVLLAELGAYLGVRKQKVGLGDLKGELMGIFQSTAKKKIKETPGEVLLMTKNAEALPPPAGESPDRPAYDTTQLILTEPLRRGAELIALSAVGDAHPTLQYQVDGVGYGGSTIERRAAGAAITYLKRLSGADINEKRKPQKGAMKATIGGHRHDLEVHTAGSAGGETLRILVNPKKRFTQKIDDLGFTDEQRNTFKGMLTDGGLVLVATPKGHGLTTTLYALIRAHDAFLSHIQTIERNPEVDLEGVTQNNVAASTGKGAELQMVSWVVSQEPDTVMIDRVEDPRSAIELVKFAGTGKRVYVGLTAGNTFDALNQWRRLVGDDRQAVKELRLIVAGRVARKLCQACKIGYHPDPETLRKLNLSPERITQLFQARQQPLRDNKGNVVACEFCHELHYHGRFGIFETFVIDDEVRQVVLAGGSVNQLRAVYRKQRGRFLQEQALAHVEKGQTSVQEVLRVLRAGESQAPVAAARTAPPPPAGGAQPSAS